MRPNSSRAFQHWHILNANTLPPCHSNFTFTVVSAWTDAIPIQIHLISTFRVSQNLFSGSLYFYFFGASTPLTVPFRPKNIPASRMWNSMTSDPRWTMLLTSDIDCFKRPRKTWFSHLFLTTLSLRFFDENIPFHGAFSVSILTITCTLGTAMKATDCTYFSNELRWRRKLAPFQHHLAPKQTFYPSSRAHSILFLPFPQMS